jgi:hypothetical protein
VPGGWGWGDDEADERAVIEAENGRAQARIVMVWIRATSRLRKKSELVAALRLTPAKVSLLNAVAVQGLVETAGLLRTRDLEISGSRHVVPPHEDVPRLLQEACDFVNREPFGDPLFLASYILWRICWIHPFDDGNGRTARAVSYLILSQQFGLELPGEHPIPERIKLAKIAYWHALEAADAAWAAGRLDVSELQRLLAHYLRAQLLDEPLGLPPGS